MAFQNLKFPGKKLQVNVAEKNWKINGTQQLMSWYLTGSTPNDYRDIRSNNYVRIEDGTLSIGNIQKSSEGYYLCEASNGIGAGLSAVIFVSVQGNSLQVLSIFTILFIKNSTIFLSL